MARKIFFDRKELLLKSCEYVKKYGIKVLNARDLCKFIGCSTQPLFKNFISMEELKKEIKNLLDEQYRDFINKIVDTNNYLYSMSYAYAMFALKEPNSFITLFVSDLNGSRSVEDVINSSWNRECIESIPKQYDMNLSEAENLYRDVRFYTHGLACQIAATTIKVNEDEIAKLIYNLIEKLKR